jgi:hypothetical protein
MIDLWILAGIAAAFAIAGAYIWFCDAISGEP